MGGQQIPEAACGNWKLSFGKDHAPTKLRTAAAASSRADSAPGYRNGETSREQVCLQIKLVFLSGRKAAGVRLCRDRGLEPILAVIFSAEHDTPGRSDPAKFIITYRTRRAGEPPLAQKEVCNVKYTAKY
jgi:hypothetical protein